MKTTLYSKDVTGTIRLWSIEEDDGQLIIQHGTKGGSIQTKYENVPYGLANRTQEEQVRSRYWSRINAQYDKGYVDTIEEAERNKRVNSLGLVRPMLAQPIKNVRRIDFSSAFYQHKYDGNRCLVTRHCGKTIAYSRNGKKINSIDHILKGIRLQEGQVIDGELYCHGVSLQKICSWVKREQDATANLSLRVYDLVENSPYISRLEALQALVLGDKAIVVPTVRVREESDLDSLLEGSIKDGYEGGILRWGEAGYEDGKRSKSLAKIKVFHDDEFIVIDVLASKDGWARLELEMPEGQTFLVSAPGSIQDKELILAEAEKYIGQSVNIKFSNITKDGIPFHPIATAFRDKGAE